MSYMWNEFNIKTFPAETIVYRDGKYCPDLSTIKSGQIDKKYDLPVHIIYVGEIIDKNDLFIDINVENQPVFLSVDIKNKRVYGGGFGLPKGSAFCEQNLIVIYRYDIDSRLSLLNAEEKIKLRQYVDDVNSEDINAAIAHESQHIRNYRAGGYNYIANSGNIYECMMLSLADEMSAMLAGYLHKYKNLDKALADVFKNLSGAVRQGYIAGQFQKHFISLQKVHGKNKNLYEHKFDSKKIHKILKYYFTIDGVQVMDTMSKESKLKFGQFVVDVKSDIKKHIDNQIIMSKISQKSM